MPLRRLRPIAARSRLRITLAALLLPAIGIITLAQVGSVRRPLSEREAALAVATRPPGEDAGWVDIVPRAAGEPTSSAVFLASIGPRLFGNGELPLRAAGLAAGALALGAAVQLGERLFATRVGVIAAGLLLAAPEGRALLGTRLTVDPFYLLAMLGALTAIRNLARTKVSAVYGGIGAGIAMALVGSTALWLPVLALIWLRHLRGLDLRSTSTVLVWTAASLGIAVTASAALLGREPIWSLAPPAALEVISPCRLALGLLPIAPLALLGAWYLPSHWTRNESMRFLCWWLVAASTAAALTGSLLGVAVGLLFLSAALATWALDRAPRRIRWAVLGAGAVLFAALPGGSHPPGGPLEPWAAREAARFVRHALPAEGRIAAVDSAARRIAFYSRRDIATFESREDLASADYVVLDRQRILGLEGTFADNDREVLLSGTAMRVLAEFGPWIVARIHHLETFHQGPPGNPLEVSRRTAVQR